MVLAKSVIFLSWMTHCRNGLFINATAASLIKNGGCCWKTKRIRITKEIKIKEEN